MARTLQNWLLSSDAEAINPHTTTEGKIKGILSFREEKTGRADLLPTYEAVIFCDEKRLFPVESNDAWLFDDVLKDSQEATTKENCQKDIFMYTYTFKRHADSIQICPWFLQYIKGKKFQTVRGVTQWRAFLAVVGVDKLITKVKYRPIDLLSLWDKVMLHEMMHTTAGYEKKDIDEFGGYGWKNCKALSTDPECIDNADSFAILGSALYWKTQGREIDGNGKFTTPPSTKKRWNWLGSGAGQGQDTIKVDAVKQFV